MVKIGQVRIEKIWQEKTWNYNHAMKFIFIYQLPVWYKEVSLFSINYFVISTAGTCPNHYQIPWREQIVIGTQQLS